MPLTMQVKTVTLFLTTWFFIGSFPATTQAQKLSHSAMITGVKERIVRAEGSPTDRDAILNGAIELLQSAVTSDKKDKDREETYFYLGYLYYRLADFDKAWEALQKASTFGRRHLDKGEKLSGGIVIFSINETLNDIKLKTFNQGNRAYSDATATTFPDSIAILMPKAIAKFSKLCHWDPQVIVNGQSFAANVQGILANANVQLMNVEKDETKRNDFRSAAIGNLTKFLEHDKENIAVHQFVSQLYFQGKDNAKCIEWIDKALAIPKTDSASLAIKAQMISEKALILDVMGKPDEALATYTEAIKSNPNNADLHFNLARLYLTRKDAEKALEQFKVVKKLKPDDAESNYQVADEIFRVYMRRRSDEIEKFGTKVDMKKVTDLLKPDIEEARKNLDDAIEVISRNLSALPDQAEANYRIGKCYNMIAELEGHKAYHLESKEKVKLQRPFFEKAVDYLKKSVLESPDHKTTWHQLGTAYLNLQLKKEAEEAFAKAK